MKVGGGSGGGGGSVGINQNKFCSVKGQTSPHLTFNFLSINFYGSWVNHGEPLK